MKQQRDENDDPRIPEATSGRVSHRSRGHRDDQRQAHNDGPADVIKQLVNVQCERFFRSHALVSPQLHTEIEKVDQHSEEESGENADAAKYSANIPHGRSPFSNGEPSGDGYKDKNHQVDLGGEFGVPPERVELTSRERAQVKLGRDSKSPLLE